MQGRRRKRSDPQGVPAPAAAASHGGPAAKTYPRPVPRPVPRASERMSSSPKVETLEPNRETEHTGTVDQWVTKGPTGGWGFIMPDQRIENFNYTREDEKVFVHRANVSKEVDTLVVGQKVAFRVQPPIKEGRDWQAARVRILQDVAAPEQVVPGRRRGRRGSTGGKEEKKDKMNTAATAGPDAQHAIDPITFDTASDKSEAEDAPTAARASVMHGILGQMKVGTIPHYGAIIPLNAVPGYFPSTVPVEAIIWEPKEVPSGSDKAPWEARPVNPNHIMLQRIAGMKPEDKDNAKLTLHFVLSRKHSAVALKTATVGGINREPRYAQYLGPPIEEGELVRIGLREAEQLPALKEAQKEPPQSADAGNTSQGAGAVVDAEKASAANTADGGKTEGDEPPEKKPGIHFTAHGSETPKS